MKVIYESFFVKLQFLSSEEILLRTTAHMAVCCFMYKASQDAI